MENAADALQMAAFVLIFVLALSISINAFGEVRQTSQILLDYRDREYDSTYIEENNPEKTKRKVRVETIIPSIYKAYRENYKVVFKKNETKGMELYKKVAKNSNEKISVCSIDLQQIDVLGSDANKEKFLEVLLYGYEDEDEIKIFTENGLTLEKIGLYEKIKDKTFEESLGVYYQEDIQTGSGDTETETKSDTNKNKKRVIIYTLVEQIN